MFTGILKKKNLKKFIINYLFSFKWKPKESAAISDTCSFTHNRKILINYHAQIYIQILCVCVREREEFWLIWCKKELSYS